jgi:hypothetical protein
MAIFDGRERHYEKIIDNRDLVAVNRAVSVASIKISIGGIALGYIQNYTGNQNRPATPLYEIGSVGIIEHIPGQPNYTLTINKLAVYRINFMKMATQAGMKAKNEDLYNAIRTRLNSSDPIIDFSVITEAPIPFDILVQQKDPVDNVAILKTQWIDCLVTASSETVAVGGNLTIAENLTLVARKPKYSQSDTGLVYPPA